MELESRLAKMLPMVKEANIILKELNRDVEFSTKLVNIFPEGISNPLE